MRFITTGVSVIGGADGPTAIFVTGRPGPVGLLLAAGLLAAVAAGIWVLVRRHRDTK